MSNAIARIRAYHKVTKHSFSGYAPSPGFLDWDAQPNPFRRYDGAPLFALPLQKECLPVRYSDLYTGTVEATPLTRESLSRFLELAFGLSAWKTTGMESWSLRHNPSSGNLHPTEAYIILWQAIDHKFVPGIYHYAAHEHALELRAVLAEATAQKLQKMQPNCFGALGLSSIHWREEWKYGARALRYCQHDVGHALASASYSAAMHGWQIRADTTASDQEIVDVLGLAHSNSECEPEHPDLIAFIAPRDSEIVDDSGIWNTLARWVTDWRGSANQLSGEHAHWPQIISSLPFLEKTSSISAQPSSDNNIMSTASESSQVAEKIIRQRRSAQRMQLGDGISRQEFLQMLARTLPSSRSVPFAALPYTTAVNLLIFVHKVDGLAPGLYALVRSPNLYDNFKQAMQTQDFSWEPVEDCELPLYTLSAPMDYRKTASQLSCYQGIAGHSAFSLGMIANMQNTIETEGAWAYRRLFWEAGLIGQVLYLEAEACGLSGTGIGCFFDDNVHDLLGLEAEGNWQSLYHFTVGKARVDQRLTTLSGYHHLQRNKTSGEPLDEPVAT